MPEIPSIVASVSTSYLELTKAAEVLNGVTDAFGKAVSDIDEALKKLNLGIVAWVMVDEQGGHSDDPVYHIQEIGYSKVSGKWGIALRTRTGNVANSYDDREEVEIWLFNEATRALRLKAIEKLPELVNKLSKEATQMTKQLQLKLSDIQAVAAVLNPPKAKGFVVKGLAADHASVSRLPQPNKTLADALAQASEAARQASAQAAESISHAERAMKSLTGVKK